MKKSTIQWIVIGYVVVFWSVGAVVAVFDGNELLKFATPILTIIFGWLFTSSVT
jgi:hypothetical protein